jgi:hypothetical protein
MVTPDDNPIPADVLADMQAVAEALAAGKLVAPEITQGIHERSEKAQKELLRRYGVQELAVDLVRKNRDEE